MRRAAAAWVLVGALACALALEGAPLERASLEGLMARAERARGLGFGSPVSARVVAPRELRGLLARELEQALEPGELEGAEWSARSIGLLPIDTDLRRALLDFGGVGLGGFYSALRGRLYVLGPRRGLLGRLRRAPVEPRPPDEVTLLHELAHVLQDRHSSLLDVTLGVRENDDLIFAVGAFLEGEALWTGFRDQELRAGAAPPAPEAYAAEMSPAWADAEYPDTPRILREPMVLQYPLGYALAAALAARGGTPALDAALRDPPLSSEQLLHPARYLEGGRRDPPALLELPERAPQGCQTLYRNSLGELGLRIWLAERRGGASERARPADGWAGDRLVAWRCGERAAFAWLVRFDAPAEAREFAVVARDALATLEAPLAGTPELQVLDADVWLTAGLPSALRDELRAGVRARAYPDLASYLAEHPEVLTRARELRGTLRNRL